MQIYDKLSESEQGEYQQKKALYDSIFEQFIPGFSPLEQAISIYLKLKGQSSKEERDDDDEDKEDKEIDMTKRLDFDRELYFDPTIK